MKVKGRGYDIDASGLSILSAGHVLSFMKVKWDDVLYIKHVEGTRVFNCHYYGLNGEMKSVRSAMTRVNKNHQFKVDENHVETLKKLCQQCVPSVKYEQRKRTILESQSLFLVFSAVLIIAALFIGFIVLQNPFLGLGIGLGATVVLNIVGFIVTDRSKLINVYRPAQKPQRYQLPF